MDLKSTFGFHTTPCTREIRTEDLLRLPPFDEAADGIHRALEKRMSAALIAPPGTGKSTVIRTVIARLPEARYRVHIVRCAGIGKRDMCRAIALACNVPSAGLFPALVVRLQEHLESLYSNEGIRPVLVMDEAHDLRPDVLNLLRILTNFQMDSRLVLSIVLVGQPDLGKLLARNDLEAIARRIVHYATLRHLSRDETTKYVEHRCILAGARSCPFDAAALDAIFEIGRGNLRMTDSLVLESVETAARAKAQTVGAFHIANARRVLWP